jgi:LPS O-antigen subunit length determinant protein (WzzB/FepE family)
MDFVVLAMGRKWTMLAITLLCGFGALALTYMLPQVFMAQATLLPPDRLSSYNLLSKFKSGFALEMLKEVENPSVDLLQNILESRSLDERLAQDSAIHRYFSAQGLHGKEMVLAVQKSIKFLPGFSKVDVQGTVGTGWFPTGAQKENARVMSSYFTNLAIDCMDSTLRAAIRSLAHSTMLFADSDYALKSRELDSLDHVQEAFEQANGVVKLEAQTIASIEHLGELKAARDEAEIKLHLLELDLSDDATKKEEAVAKLNEAEFVANTYETERQIGPALDSLPEVSRRYAAILRARKELEPIVSFLRIETEQQRIFEVREKSFITVLDPAEPPETRISPIRSQMGILGLIVGAALSIVYMAFYGLRLSWKKERKSRNETRPEVLEAAKSIFAHNNL